MGIKLDVSVETPVSDDDRDILAGVSAMMFAIANRQNVAEQATDSPQGEDDEGLIPCGEQNKHGDCRCLKEVGHIGPHDFQPVESLGPVN